MIVKDTNVPSAPNIIIVAKLRKNCFFLTWNLIFKLSHEKQASISVNETRGLNVNFNVPNQNDFDPHFMFSVKSWFRVTVSKCPHTCKIVSFAELYYLDIVVSQDINEKHITRIKA